MIVACEQAARLDAGQRHNILIEEGQRPEILVNIGCWFTAGAYPAA